MSNHFRKLAVVLSLAGATPNLTAQMPNPFTLTHFTVVDAGTVGKPDVLLLPGLSSSRAVWDAEAVKLAPNMTR